MAENPEAADKLPAEDAAAQKPGSPAWWTNFDRVLVLVVALPLVLAVASIAYTCAISWTNEGIESRALHDKVTLKYLELASQSELGGERRARIFGYLAAALESSEQREWAKAAAEAKCQVEVDALQRKLRQAIDESRSALEDYVLGVADAEQKRRVEEVLVFRRQLQELAGK